MDAESGGSAAATMALAIIEKRAHEAASDRTRLKIHNPARPRVPQIEAVEQELADSIAELKRRNLIFGEPLTLDEFLEPAEEQEVGRSFQFEGADEAIVAAVRQEMAEKQGQVIEVDEDMEPEPEMSRAEILALCQKLENACLQLGDATSSVSLDLVSHIRLFRARIRREELLHGRQTTLESYFTS